MERTNSVEADRWGTFKRWAPAALVTLVLLAAIVGGYAGVKAVVTKPEPQSMADPVATPETFPIEEYTPAEGEPLPELDEYGNPIPQRVPVDVAKYPAVKPSEGCSTLTLPRTDPFCSNMSDRALTDRHVAKYMLPHAAYRAGSRSTYDREVSKDATHWLRQVVATPVEDGGPDLTYRAEFLRILDSW